MRNRDFNHLLKHLRDNLESDQPEATVGLRSGLVFIGALDIMRQDSEVVVISQTDKPPIYIDVAQIEYVIPGSTPHSGE